MSTQKLKDRWLIAASAIGIHISIGSVYAYSVMTNPVKDIFDVDGTLTDPRKKMDPSFANEFVFWMKNKQCFVATGSDYIKTKEQVPWDILDEFKNLFCCMGNEVRGESGKVLSKSEFVIPHSLNDELDNQWFKDGGGILVIKIISCININNFI